MPELQHIGDDGFRCAFCARPAAGPCASCGKPVCGDCCTLTEGGAKVWAICLDCDRRGGRSLWPAWARLLGLVAGVVVVLVAVAGLLALALS